MTIAKVMGDDEHIFDSFAARNELSYQISEIVLSCCQFGILRGALLGGVTIPFDGIHQE